jgi:hypothetical protein
MPSQQAAAECLAHVLKADSCHHEFARTAIGDHCRLDDSTSAISTGGLIFDPKKRSMGGDTFGGQRWAVDATSSTWTGSFWTPSGATIFNYQLLIQLQYHIVFNEVRCNILQDVYLVGLVTFFFAVDQRCVSGQIF